MIGKKLDRFQRDLGARPQRIPLTVVRSCDLEQPDDTTAWTRAQSAAFVFAIVIAVFAIVGLAAWVGAFL